ncbi:uncharacterized protein LOC129748923 [Uranotaenia lowii]|uniref:uncharacterized protein LOC129748923 n=1 Tax=Uranotaenia lowii TaxID=190385 RepID=UPI0024794D26|nr:uncharacterized protein LOC129748923 [Uranotaenia lowii]
MMIGGLLISEWKTEYSTVREKLQYSEIVHRFLIPRIEKYHSNSGMAVFIKTFIRCHTSKDQSQSIELWICLKEGQNACEQLLVGFRPQYFFRNNSAQKEGKKYPIPAQNCRRQHNPAVHRQR